MNTNDSSRADAVTLTSEELAVLKAIANGEAPPVHVGIELFDKGLFEIDIDAKTCELTPAGRRVLEAASVEPEGEKPATEAQTFGELCEREIVKIRELTLKDDEYTSHLLGEAVGSPVGVTLCVETRMKQISDLQAEVISLKKQIKKLKRTANLDDGFIDFLTTKDGE